MTLSQQPNPFAGTGPLAAPPTAPAADGTTWSARLAMRVWKGKTGLQLFFDVASWGTAGLLATAVMGGGLVSGVELGTALVTAVVLQLLLGLLIGLYRESLPLWQLRRIRRHRHHRPHHRVRSHGRHLLEIFPFVLLAVLSAVILMTGSRYVVRWSHQMATRPRQGERVLKQGR